MESAINRVLSEYSSEHSPLSAKNLGTDTKGAQHWLLETRAGNKELRAWPKRVPSLSRIQFLQAVLWHTVCEGFGILPLPIAAKNGSGYVYAQSQFWEMLPFFDGSADLPKYRISTLRPLDFGLVNKFSTTRMAAALKTLALFHKATECFPLPHAALVQSPRIAVLLPIWKKVWNADVPKLSVKIKAMLSNGMKFSNPMLDLAILGNEFLQRSSLLRCQTDELLDAASQIHVSVQPILGNAHRSNFLFKGDAVQGIKDCTQLEAECVSYDVASLIGSCAGADEQLWALGMAAYHSLRPLSKQERFLVGVFELTEPFLNTFELLEKAISGNIDPETCVETLRWQIIRLRSFFPNKRKS